MVHNSQFGATNGLIRRFLSARAGNTGIMFAFALVPLMGITGMAVDYSRALNMKTSMDAIADSAVLSALAPRNVNVFNTPAQQDAASQAAAVTAFNSGTKPPGIIIQSVTATVTRPNNNVSVNLTYSADMETSLAKIFGMNTIPISGTAASSAAGLRYVDIYVLADKSASMGIGATAADQSLMSSTIGCTLACHANGTDATAHAAGAVLRFDVLKSALASIVSQAQSAGSSNVLRFGIYSFADSMATEIDITSNLSAVSSAVSSMQLAGFDAGTNTAFALSSLKNKITTAYGDGSSPAKPLVYVLFLTDAIGNSVDNTPAGPWIISSNFIPYTPHSIADPLNDGQMDLTGLNPAWCQPLKTAGSTMMTLELQYVLPAAQVASDLRSKYINNTLKAATTSNMQACASNTAVALSASLPADIQTATQKLFATTLVSSARLTK